MPRMILTWWVTFISDLLFTWLTFLSLPGTRTKLLTGQESAVLWYCLPVWCGPTCTKIAALWQRTKSLRVGGWSICRLSSGPGGGSCSTEAHWFSKFHYLVHYFIIALVMMKLFEGVKGASWHVCAVDLYRLILVSVVVSARKRKLAPRAAALPARARHRSSRPRSAPCWAAKKNLLARTKPKSGTDSKCRYVISFLLRLQQHFTGATIERSSLEQPSNIIIKHEYAEYGVN